MQRARTMRAAAAAAAIAIAVAVLIAAMSTSTHAVPDPALHPRLTTPRPDADAPAGRGDRAAASGRTKDHHKAYPSQVNAAALGPRATSVRHVHRCSGDSCIKVPADATRDGHAMYAQVPAAGAPESPEQKQLSRHMLEQLRSAAADARVHAHEQEAKGKEPIVREPVYHKPIKPGKPALEVVSDAMAWGGHVRHLKASDHAHDHDHDHADGSNDRFTYGHLHPHQRSDHEEHDWCGTDKAGNIARQRKLAATAAKERGMSVNQDDLKRMLAGANVPNVCDHSATVCDLPLVQNAYVAALENGDKEQLTMRITVLALEDGLGNVVPDLSQVAYMQQRMNDAFADDSNIAYEFSSVTISPDWPDKKRASSLIAAPGCPANWIGDAYCDEDCNSPELDYDGGDCSTFDYSPVPNPTCKSSWKGDGECDAVCNNWRNNYDEGDCCPETNAEWDTNYPNGLGRVRSVAPGTSQYIVQGCVDPNSPNRLWLGDDKAYGDDYKNVFASCEIDGESCAAKSMVLYMPSAFPTGNYLLGFATFPWDSAVTTLAGGVMMSEAITWGVSQSHQDQATTLIHEGGHDLGLYHTHNDVACDSNCFEGPIAGNGPSSQLVGDLCSDTRPTSRNFKCQDPSDTDCTGGCGCSPTVYTNTPFRNYMGYSDGTCMDRMTAQQGARVRCYAEYTFPKWLTTEAKPFIPAASLTVTQPTGGVKVRWLKVILPVGKAATTLVTYQYWGCYDSEAGLTDGFCEVETVDTGNANARYTISGVHPEAWIRITVTPKWVDSGATGTTLATGWVLTNKADGSAPGTPTWLPGATPPEGVELPGPGEPLPDPGAGGGGGDPEPPSCGDQAFSGTTKAGTLVSPADTSTNSGTYANGLDCSWTIGHTNSDVVLISFSAFSTEAGADIVTVSNALGTIVLTASGASVPAPITALGGRATVAFTTNDNRAESGWALTFESCGAALSCNNHGTCNSLAQCACATGYAGAKCDSCTSGYEGYPNCVLKSIPKSCAGRQVYVARSGVVSDGSGGAQYTHENDCEFVISPPTVGPGAAPVDVLAAKFIEFDTEAVVDVVTVYQGTGRTGLKLMTHAGRLLPPSPSVYTLDAASMTVVFETDANTAYSGWTLEYVTCAEASATARTDCAGSPTCEVVCDCGSADGGDVKCYICSSTFDEPPFCGIVPEPATLGDGTCDAANNDFAFGYDLGDCCSGDACAAPEPDTRPPNVYMVGQQPWHPVHTTLLTTASFEAVADEDGCTFHGSLDGGDAQVPEAGQAPRWQFSDLGVGAHTFAVYAVDAAGNQSPTVTYAWTVAEVTCHGQELLAGETSGTFTDGSVGDYDNYADCSWLIVAPPGEVVTLAWDDFALEPAADGSCLYDYVDIFDGASRDAPFAESYCGTELPPPFTSSGNALLVVFRSDFVITAAGFSASYTTGPDPDATAGDSDALCAPTTVDPSGGGSFTDGSAAADEYASNTDCAWILSGGATDVVLLNFTRFGLETPEEDGWCWDYVRVYDGSDSSGHVLLDHTCGDELPGEVSSFSNAMFVQFSSDSVIQSTGFAADWSTEASPYACPSLAGALADGHYSCTGDKLGDVCTPLCTDGKALDVASVVFGVRVCDIVDGAPAWTGPDAECVEPGCSGTTAIDLTGATTSGFFSDGSPEDKVYFPESRCSWVLTAGATDGTPDQITLEFDRLDVELGFTHGDDGLGCEWDSVVVYDGSAETGTAIGTLCGSNLALVGSTYTARSGVMTVVFTSDASIQGMGFLAKYTTHAPLWCSGRVQISPEDDEGMTTTLFSDGSGDAAYDNNANCEWVIRAPYLHNATVTFTGVDVEADALNAAAGGTGNVLLRGEDAASVGTGACPFDSVQLYHRPWTWSSWQPLGAFCGDFTSTPLVFASPFRTILVKFVTDGSITGAGWQAEATYSATEVQDPCQAHTMLDFTDAGEGPFTGVITDGTGAGDLYLPNSLCTWTFQAPPGYLVHLEFPRVELEEDDWCSYDYVAVLNPQAGYHNVDDDYRLYLDQWMAENHPEGGYIDNYWLADGGFQWRYMDFGGSAGGPCVNVAPGCRVTRADDEAHGIIVAINDAAAPPTYDVLLDSGAFDGAAPQNEYSLAWGDVPPLESIASHTYCHASGPAPSFTSTSNIASLVWASDFDIQFTGFTAHYTVYNPSAPCDDCDSCALDPTEDLGGSADDHGEFQCPESGLATEGGYEQGTTCTLACDDGYVLVDGSGNEVGPSAAEQAAHSGTTCGISGEWTELNQGAECASLSSLVPDDPQDACSPTQCALPTGYCTVTGCKCMPGYAGETCSTAVDVAQYFWTVTPWTGCDLSTCSAAASGTATRDAACMSSANPGAGADLWTAATAADCFGAAVPITSRHCPEVTCGEDEVLQLVLTYSVSTLRLASGYARITHQLESELAAAMGLDESQVWVISHRIAPEGSANTGPAYSHGSNSADEVGEGAEAPVQFDIWVSGGVAGPASTFIANLVSDPDSPVWDSATLQFAVVGSLQTHEIDEDNDELPGDGAAGALDAAAAAVAAAVLGAVAAVAVAARQEV